MYHGYILGRGIAWRQFFLLGCLAVDQAACYETVLEICVKVTKWAIEVVQQGSGHGFVRVFKKVAGWLIQPEIVSYWFFF